MSTSEEPAGSASSRAHLGPSHGLDNGSNSESATPSASMRVMVVSATSSSTVTTTLASTSNANNNNKKHNFGYRLRRLFFPQFRSTTGTPLNKHKSTKDVENIDSQNFLRHSNSLYSTSSSETDHNRSSSSKRKRTRNQAQQTDTLPEFPSLPPASLKLAQPNSHGELECSICLLLQCLSQYPELSNCQHRVCLTCLRQYLRIEIFESRINITCPECSELLHPNDIKLILQDEPSLVEKYELFMVRRFLITDPDSRWCPAPDCNYCVIASGCASCPKLRCERPGCDTLFCYHCKQEWHPNQTCDQARVLRGRSLLTSSGSQTKSGVTFRNRTETSQTPDSPEFTPLHRTDIKPCPCCKVFIIKMDDGSCNHMTCSVCGTEFCWLCMQKISDLHYLSPSGCTFWGKKPWSRKKKIMWQLGMLVGAPVGIALIAGIAVPAIIIGIPVWVGRKLYARFERNHISRPKSNLLVTTGVLTSILVSPILAAVAVGIGVPILLAYVYGVVPISLCRSGGCGVITSSSGVKLDLDEDELSANVAPDGVSVDTVLSGHRGIANPSIGDISLGLSTSLSIGSSSHLDRAVLDTQQDRESSSIAACAGSIASSSQPPAALSNRSETSVDVISNKRYSFSSQNADATSMTLSLGDRSINTNLSVDDASMRVHVGSIRERASPITPHYSLSPVEVHVDIGAGNETNKPGKSSKSIQTKSTAPVDCVSTVSGNSATVLGKYESRSLEYLSSNYCKLCHQSHKPCCPKFQHHTAQISLSKYTALLPTRANESNSVGAGSSNSNNRRSKNDCSLNETVVLIQSSNGNNNTVNQPDGANISETISGTIPRQQQHSSSIQRQQSIQSNSDVGRNLLTKKAVSQIFSSNNFSDGSNSATIDLSATTGKSGLSHSVSFTMQNLSDRNNNQNDAMDSSYIV